MEPSVAVVGATGAVGEVMRQVLVDRNFQMRSIKFLASERSAGKTIRFKDKSYPVEAIRPEAFVGIDIVLSSTPAGGQPGDQPDGRQGKAPSSSITPAPGAWTRRCRWSCPRSTPMP